MTEKYRPIFSFMYLVNWNGRRYLLITLTLLYCQFKCWCLSVPWCRLSSIFSPCNFLRLYHLCNFTTCHQMWHFLYLKKKAKTIARTIKFTLYKLSIILMKIKQWYTIYFDVLWFLLYGARNVMSEAWQLCVCTF